MEKLDLTYPRKFRCVQSSCYPLNWKHNTDQIDFNEIANHIANEVNRTPYERMQDLIKHNLLDKARKNYLR
jgi:hypothetical protein